MDIKNIMTKEVISLHPNDTVEHAAMLMREHNIGAIPVCDGEKVIGIVTDRDITIRTVAEGKNMNAQNVREIMSSNPVLGNTNMSVDDAARIMSERQIRRLPVVANDQLVGMVSLGDLAVQPSLKQEAGEALTEISVPSTPRL